MGRYFGRYDSVDSFFYLDPPYVPATRSGDGGYMYEMNSAGHQRLIDVIKSLKGKVNQAMTMKFMNG